MASADTYSRMVRALKVALPLAALVILSTLFIIAEGLDPDAAIPYAEVDIDQMIRDQGITRPEFGGVSETGVTVSVSADAVKRQALDRLAGTRLDARLDFPDGSTVDISSPSGVIDLGEGTAMLSGGASVTSSTGYTVETDTVTASMNEASVETGGEITGNGPAGRFLAGRMTLTRGDDGNHLLVFNEGVRLVYEPGS